MFRGFKSVLGKEFRHIQRDGKGLAFALLLPFIMIFIYGYGINLDVRNVRTAIVDLSGGLHAARLARIFAAGGTFVPVPMAAGRAGSPLAEAERAMRRGTVRGILVVPRGFDEDIALGRRARVEIVIDGADALSARLIAAAEEKILSGFRDGPGVSISPAGEPGGVRLAFNPDGRSLTSLIPGLFAIILTVAASLLTCAAIVREREAGTLDRLTLSPLRSGAIILGKALAYAPVIALDGILVLALSRLWFRIPVRGDWTALGLYGALAALSALGLGVFISAAVSTQREAMIALNLSTLLPSFLLSGFILPLDSLPAGLRAAAEVLPATHFIRISRGLMLKDADPLIYIRDGAALAVFAATTLTGAVLVFSRRRRFPR